MGCALRGSFFEQLWQDRRCSARMSLPASRVSDPRLGGASQSVLRLRHPGLPSCPAVSSSCPTPNMHACVTTAGSSPGSGSGPEWLGGMRAWAGPAGKSWLEVKFRGGQLRQGGSGRRAREAGTSAETTAGSRKRRPPTGPRTVSAQ